MSIPTESDLCSIVRLSQPKERSYFKPWLVYMTFNGATNVFACWQERLGPIRYLEILMGKKIWKYKCNLEKNTFCKVSSRSVNNDDIDYWKSVPVNKENEQ